MKMITMESAYEAGKVYAVLKTALNSVGLENNQVLSSFIKYASFFIFIFEIAKDNLTWLGPYVDNYVQAIITTSSNYFKYKIDHHSYMSKVSSLCNKNTDNITQEHQKKILQRICNEYKFIESNGNKTNISESNISNHTQEQLFSTAHDNYKALCIILGDQELCSEVLLCGEHFI